MTRLIQNMGKIKYYNNNNQAFYSQVSWDSLEMKSHEPKNRGKNKSEKVGA
jgi:hypothetical protein